MSSMHSQVHPTVSDTKPMSHGSPHRYFTGSGEQRTSFSLFISETILGWHGPTSHSADQLKNGTLGSLPSASANITWAILPNSSEEEHGSQPEPEVSAPSPPLLAFVLVQKVTECVWNWLTALRGGKLSNARISQKDKNQLLA